MWIDKTGQPRTDKEIHEALDAIKEIMVKQPLVLPLFTVHAGIIRDCLTELLFLREKLREAKKVREAQHD